jgi:hypothetical protein
VIDCSASPSNRCFGGAEELLPRRLFISLSINRTSWLQRERPAAAAERTAENKEPKLVRAGMTIAQKSKFIVKHGICRRRAANRRKQQRKQEAGTASPEGRYGIGDDMPRPRPPSPLQQPYPHRGGASRSRSQCGRSSRSRGTSRSGRSSCGRRRCLGRLTRDQGPARGIPRLVADRFGRRSAGVANGRQNGLGPARTEPVVVDGGQGSTPRVG